MGSAFAQRLLALGYSVAGWNRSPRTIHGVTLMKSAADVVNNSDLALISLFDGDAVAAVLRTLAGSDLQRNLVIDTSTVSPQSSRDTGEWVATINGRFIDVPMLGTTEPARRGELVGLAGGSLNDVADASSVLRDLTRKFHHMGPIGAGSATKLAVNLVMGSYWAALHDALSLADKHGIELGRVLEIIRDGPAALAALSKKLRALEEPDLPAEFDVTGSVKDFRTILAAAGEALCLRTAEATLTTYLKAQERGFGCRDVATIALGEAKHVKCNAAPRSDV